MNSFLDKLIRFEVLDLYQWLVEHRITLDEQSCSYCYTPMTFKIVSSTTDGCVFRCTNTSCLKYETTKSIRTHSWISNFKIPIKEIIKSIYLWSCGRLYTEIKQECRISAPVFIRLRKLLINKIQTFWSRNPIKLGGPNIIVQVDEMKLNHNVKAHRGRTSIRPTWILTMVDTSTTPALGYAEIIPNKEAGTIIPIIERVVRSGSKIHSDEAKVYKVLQRSENYEHSWVTHKYHFVDPNTGTHTQNVESFNNKIKRKSKDRNGIDDDKRKDFLSEFLFLDHQKEKAFDVILELLML